MVDMEMDFRSSSSSHDNAANPLISKEDGLVPSMPLVAWASPNTGLRLKWQFGCSLVFYTMILLVTATQTALISQLWRTKPAPEILGEINGLVPEFGTQVVRFTATKQEGRRALNTSDEAWQTIMPIGGGFIEADNWERYQKTLPPAIHDHGKNAFTVAAFHQIHCLHYILTEFNILLESHQDKGGRQEHDHTRGGLDTEAIDHVGHCFHYLRSSLMCCGDTALEGQASDTHQLGTLGEGSYHVCKAYGKIQAWAETSRASDAHGF